VKRALPSVEGRPLVIAHRGASAYRPENTFAAYELAIEQGADMIEIDLHTTRDGRIAIAHDATLEGLGGEGEISDHTIDALRTLDAGEGEHIPTLDEVLDAFGERIAFNLELKGDAGDRRYRGMEVAALEAVRRRGLLDRTLFSSFDDAVLRRLREAEAVARLAVLVSYKRPEGLFERAAAVQAEAVNPFFVLVDREMVEQAHAQGWAIYPYTVDEVDWMERLLDLGVDGLFTNRPDRMREVLRGRR